MKEQHREQKLFPQLLQLRCRWKQQGQTEATLRHLTPPVPLPPSSNSIRLKRGLSRIEMRQDKTANRGLIRV